MNHDYPSLVSNEAADAAQPSEVGAEQKKGQGAMESSVVKARELLVGLQESLERDDYHLAVDRIEIVYPTDIPH